MRALFAMAGAWTFIFQAVPIGSHQKRTLLIRRGILSEERKTSLLVGFFTSEKILL
jgi:hypothetical protein